MKRALAVLIVLGFGLVAARAADKAEKKAHAKPADHVVLTAADLHWADAPPTLPPGSKMAVLSGDPGKPGLFTIRVKFPAGYKVMPHWHPTTEYLTVLSGDVGVGTGDKFDEGKSKRMPAGSFISMPARMHHFVWANGETELQISANGPFKIVYLNPADDPSKGKK